jgi:hypothetical protein
MSIIKQTKDYFIKFLRNGNSVPYELYELVQYFRANEAIEFERKNEDGEIVAISKNFRFGKIITSAKDEKELDEKIKDAILTAFDVPSSYRKEAGIHKVGQKSGYAFA